MNYIPIIGLEIHIEPNTKTKMFCGCPQDHFGKGPNTQTCPICLGLPGALPYQNLEAIKKTVKLGLAMGSTISKFSNFYRKHYFYPDLPKSFQTSQKDHPLCIGGKLLDKKINHIHLEEDAGKLIHKTIDGEKVTLVDFNRSGCALIELVTEPVFRNADEVLAFTKELQQIARDQNISGADMEKGTMRLEANVSVSMYEDKLPDYKVELKNINSFKFLVSAIETEINRQTNALEKGEKLVQETRGYDEARKTTFSQRSKEEAQDYRYFPEADLPPIELSDGDINEIKKQIVELPSQRVERLIKDENLPRSYASLISVSQEKTDIMEKIFVEGKKLGFTSKALSDVAINDIGLDKITDHKLFISKFKELKNKSYASEEQAENAVKEVVAEEIKAIGEYKAGKEQVIGFLIGMVQKKLQGKGDPKLIMSKLKENLR